MFFNTAHPVGASFNNARTIDSVLANGLEAIPGGSGIMAILAARNLRRGLALGLPSGQGAADALGLTPLTAAQLMGSGSVVDRQRFRVQIGIVRHAQTATHMLRTARRSTGYPRAPGMAKLP